MKSTSYTLMNAVTLQLDCEKVLENIGSLRQKAWEKAIEEKCEPRWTLFGIKTFTTEEAEHKLKNDCAYFSTHYVTFNWLYDKEEESASKLLKIAKRAAKENEKVRVTAEDWNLLSGLLEV